jgi:hypothetical protein
MVNVIGLSPEELAHGEGSGRDLKKANLEVPRKRNFRKIKYVYI